MKKYAAPAHPKDPPKPGSVAPAGGFQVMWTDLDAKWVRRIGQSVDTVEHFGVGSEISVLPRTGKLPIMAAGWTDLPHMAEQIGHSLEEHDDYAAVVVSDMLVDTPPQPAGAMLCGTVAVPSGKGDVPTLVPRCLNEGWHGRPPAGLSIVAVALHDPQGDQSAFQPLIVTIFGRNHAFVSGLASEIESAMSGFQPARLDLIDLPSIVACKRITECQYAATRSLLARDGCSFIVSSAPSRGRLKMACAVEFPEAPSAGLLDVSFSALAVADAETAETDRNGVRVIDVGFPLDSKTFPAGSPPLSFAAANTASWEAKSDAASTIDAWIGSPWSATPDYRDVYRPMVTIIARQAAAPICAEQYQFGFSWR